MRSRGLLIGDADQGIVFPAIFAIGVLLLSTVFAGIGVSSDTVLAGDLNLLALSSNHVIVGALDIGPADMWIQLATLALMVAFLALTGRVLTTAPFDRAPAVAIGFPVRAVEMAFMVLIALTVVKSFSVAGSIIVVAFMICPAATGATRGGGCMSGPAAPATLCATTRRGALALTVAIATVNSTLGFALSYTFDLATAPTLAVMSGLTFVAVFATTAALKR